MAFMRCRLGVLPPPTAALTRVLLRCLPCFSALRSGVVILAGIAVFRNPVPPLNAVASAVAVAGTWFYAQAEQAQEKAKKERAAAAAKGA